MSLCGVASHCAVCKWPRRAKRSHLVYRRPVTGNGTSEKVQRHGYEVAEWMCQFEGRIPPGHRAAHGPWHTVGLVRSLTQSFAVREDRYPSRRLYRCPATRSEWSVSRLGRVKRCGLIQFLTGEMNRQLLGPWPSSATCNIVLDHKCTWDSGKTEALTIANRAAVKAA